MRALVVVLILAGCTPAVTVRAPSCELKPLPLGADVPCEKPTPIPDGQMQTLYLEHFIKNAMYDRCIKNINNYKAQVNDRDQKFRECQGAAQAPDKPWYRFGQ